MVFGTLDKAATGVNFRTSYKRCYRDHRSKSSGAEAFPKPFFTLPQKLKTWSKIGEKQKNKNTKKVFSYSLVQKWEKVHSEKLISRKSLLLATQRIDFLKNCEKQLIS